MEYWQFADEDLAGVAVRRVLDPQINAVGFLRAHFLHDRVGDLNLNGPVVGNCDVVRERGEDARLAVIAVIGRRIASLSAVIAAISARGGYFQIDCIERDAADRVRKLDKLARFVVRNLDCLDPGFAIADRWE